MSSDNKAITIFRKKVLKPKFQSEVLRLRLKYKVPIDGFSSIEKVDEWDKKRNDELVDYLSGIKNKKRVFDDYDDDLSNLLKTSGLSPTLFPLLTDYLASNNTNYGTLNYYTCGMDLSHGPFQHVTENKWREHNKRFVKLLISEDAEPSDVKKYIDDHWKLITIRLGKSGKKNTRIKLSREWDRDVLIYSLSRRNIKDLRDELYLFNREKIITTKEIIIGKLLSKYGHNEIGSEAVKKAIERQLKERKTDN